MKVPHRPACLRLGAAPMLALCVTFSLAACAGDTTEKGVPKASRTGNTTRAAYDPIGPRKTGVYPNLNIERGAAAEQFTPTERASLLTELTSARAEQRNESNANAAAEEARLGKLARSHGDDALKEIEGGNQ